MNPCKFLVQEGHFDGQFPPCAWGRGIFALGDCSTIEQDLMINGPKSCSRMADVNGDGTLCADEFLAIMETAKRKYPQVQVQLTYVENDCKRYQLISCVTRNCYPMYRAVWLVLALARPHFWMK